MAAATGDADIAATAELFGDRRRVRMLVALADRRSLPASVLAAEAGVAASTASVHLAKLAGAGLVTVERHGRHRYYRLADAQVAETLESLARISPATPVRSLRDGTRAHAIRAARTCYDHLAGRLGTALMSALLDRGILAGGDGLYHPDRHRRDRLAAPGKGDVDYRLTGHGRAALGQLGVDLTVRTRRPLIRYCLDWSEQRHHLSGTLGAALLCRFEELDWVRRSPRSRAVHLTEGGRTGLADTFGMAVTSRDQLGYARPQTDRFVRNQSAAATSLTI